MVARLKPVPLPISNCPFEAAEASSPVPPSETPSCGIEERTPSELFILTLLHPMLTGS